MMISSVEMTFAEMRKEENKGTYEPNARELNHSITALELIKIKR